MIDILVVKPQTFHPSSLLKSNLDVVRNQGQSVHSQKMPCNWTKSVKTISLFFASEL